MAQRAPGEVAQAVTRSLVLAAAIFVAVPAAAQDRPFLFSVSTPTEVSTPSFRLEYDVGAGEQMFQSSTANQPEQRVAAQASWRRLTVIGRFGVVALTDAPNRSTQSGEMLISLLDQRQARISMAAGGGVQREPDGVTVLLARVTAAHDAATWRLHGNVLFQKPLDPTRDTLDLAFTSGWSYRVTSGVSVGVEEVAEDLEGFWDPHEAEGGARILVGPSFHLAPHGRAWQFTATGGPAFHPVSTARISDAVRDLPPVSGRIGYAVRAGLTYRVF
jgi:hypothetical protein